jgi:hypothetical protein
MRQVCVFLRGKIIVIFVCIFSFAGFDGSECEDGLCCACVRGERADRSGGARYARVQRVSDAAVDLVSDRAGMHLGSGYSTQRKESNQREEVLLIVFCCRVYSVSHFVFRSDEQRGGNVLDAEAVLVSRIPGPHRLARRTGAIGLIDLLIDD